MINIIMFPNIMIISYKYNNEIHHLYILKHTVKYAIILIIYTAVRSISLAVPKIKLLP